VAKPLDADELTIEVAAAYPPSGNLGGYIGSAQTFSIRAIVSFPLGMDVSEDDTFSAAFEVGAGGNESKYGAQAGVNFKVIAGGNGAMLGATGIQNQNHGRQFIAQSDQLALVCDDNRIKFTVPGLSDDKLTFRVYTAKMQHNHLIVNQRNTRPDYVEMPVAKLKIYITFGQCFEGDQERRYLCGS
jgi:hypothetical protein